MNELKPEDVMISCDRAQPSDERSALREYRRRIYEAVNYSGDCDHEDVTTILLEYKKALLREKDAHIEKLELILAGVMWSVDKWLDGAELEKDEVNRSATMREKILQVVEEKDAEIERLKKEREKND